jgi:hypothetical protein
MLTTPRAALHISRQGSGSRVGGVRTGLSVNGDFKQQSESWFSKRSIMQGGAISFDMQEDNHEGFGVDLAARPSEIWSDEGFVGVPIIDAPMTFRTASFVLPILSNFDGDRIEYQTTDDLTGEQSEKWVPYDHPLVLMGNAKVWARSVDGDGKASSAVTHLIRKISHNWSLSLHTNYDPQYAASGSNALIDGISGPRHYQTGDWQGFWGNDVQGVIDLKKQQQLKVVEVGALRDIRPWIFLPREVQISTSLDSLTWTPFGPGTLAHNVSNEEEDSYVHRFRFSSNVRARYVRFKAVNFGPLPYNHLGAGNPSWTFLDEIHLIAE